MAIFQTPAGQAPVHYCHSDGALVNHAPTTSWKRSAGVFSSHPRISIGDPVEGSTFPYIIAMDPPTHDDQRKTVQGWRHKI